MLKYIVFKKVLSVDTLVLKNMDVKSSNEN